MGAINSDKTIAASVSSQMSQAANTLVAVNVSINLASRTTTGGIEEAKESVSFLANAIQTFANSINTDIDNIHSVASEFQRVDAEVQAIFESFQNIPVSTPNTKSKLMNDPISNLKGRF